MLLHHSSSFYRDTCSFFLTDLFGPPDRWIGGPDTGLGGSLSKSNLEWPCSSIYDQKYSGCATFYYVSISFLIFNVSPCHPLNKSYWWQSCICWIFLQKYWIFLNGSLFAELIWQTLKQYPIQRSVKIPCKMCMKTHLFCNSIWLNFYLKMFHWFVWNPVTDIHKWTIILFF